MSTLPGQRVRMGRDYPPGHIQCSYCDEMVPLPGPNPVFCDLCDQVHCSLYSPYCWAVAKFEGITSPLPHWILNQVSPLFIVFVVPFCCSFLSLLFLDVPQVGDGCRGCVLRKIIVVDTDFEDGEDITLRLDKYDFSGNEFEWKRFETYLRANNMTKNSIRDGMVEYFRLYPGSIPTRSFLIYPLYSLLSLPRSPASQILIASDLFHMLSLRIIFSASPEPAALRFQAHY
jgi:hypothetical protein